MKSFVDQELTFTFNCQCGSNEFKRPTWAKDLKSFFEGSFECSNCEAEHNYCSDSFKRNYTQLKLL